MPCVVTVSCLYSLWQFGNLDGFLSPFSWQPGLCLHICHSCYLSHQYCALGLRHPIACAPEDVEVIYKTTRKCSIVLLWSFSPIQTLTTSTVLYHWCPSITFILDPLMPRNCMWVSQQVSRVLFFKLYCVGYTVDRACWCLWPRGLGSLTMWLCGKVILLYRFQ